VSYSMNLDLISQSNSIAREKSNEILKEQQQQVLDTDNQVNYFRR